MNVTTMWEYSASAKRLLADVSQDNWAAVWVNLRMEFCHRFPHDILSTEHGLDFFDNVLAGPRAWKEKGEYGDNFRKMFR